ncbi:fumarylacetoacetate hydrolase family protein [Cupriavidus necator]|uniref:5-carboxymethyl-2-hydroxymuconate delta-isomerase n=1 Tax=Cupriavidus pinatubonensis (strain JMP 134 / LMG 1197) TaxID=264198 RepID=Q46NY2_CUPPJ|nr:fumarylacetoacetate hydrolase family protein [Cupriavidus necator]
MKLVSFEHAGRASFGVVLGDAVLDLAPHAAAVGQSLREALSKGALGSIAEIAKDGGTTIALDKVRLMPVIPDPAKILCVGINYASHVKETGREMPKYPMFFTRFADSQVAHDQPIIRPRASQKLDFEGELAVVIGRTARHVPGEQALNYVAGYSCYNDGSVRDWQKHTIQFTPGKNFPQTGALGPWLVTTDEIRDPSALSLTTRLNGEVVQAATTDDLIFSVSEVIAYCSTFTELRAGDVIITGTTGGVGAFREPPLWMKPGDVVEVEISKIGVLRNTIQDE